jgi:hypothetical protein
MKPAGSRLGARCWSGVRVDRVVAAGPAYPSFTSLTSSTPAFDANPTCRLPNVGTEASSREQQEEKGRKR